MVHEVILNSTLVGAGRAVSHGPSSKHLCHLQQLIPLISSYVIGKEAVGNINTTFFFAEEPWH